MKLVHPLPTRFRHRPLPHAHVVVVGGSRGVGLATARAYAATGAAVTLVAHNGAALEVAARDLGARTVVADLRDPEQVRGLVPRLEAHAPVDVLVLGAAQDLCGSFPDHDLDDLVDLFALNAVAPAVLSRHALAAMLERGRGSLVLVSSLSAHAALPGLTAYSATKAAVSRLASGLRAELRGTGVTVTLVETGPVDTTMYEAIRTRPETAAAFDRLLASRAVRLLDPEEVGRAIARASQQSRAHVVLPRRARLQGFLARLPQLLSTATVRA